MKTNVTMESEKNRELYGIVIRQETKNSFLSLTDLQEAYTRARIQNNWAKKNIQSDILNIKGNIERIYYLLSEQKLINTEISVFTEMVEKNGMVKTLKSIGVYKTSGRAENKQSMCNPYIWVLIAMELNPQLYAKVVIWLTDKLIFNRIEACEMNKELRSAMSSIPYPDYAKINIALNKKVFGRHEIGIRNTGSEIELNNLYKLEDNIAFCIKKGFYKTNEEILEAIKTA